MNAVASQLREASARSLPQVPTVTSHLVPGVGSVRLQSGEIVPESTALDDLLPAIWAKLRVKHGRNRGAAEKALGLDLRLLLLALDRMTSGGHCPFGPGEVRQLLLKSDGDPYSPQALNQARRKLQEADLLSPESTLQCLWIPMEVADLQLNKRRSQRCPTHDTNECWSLLHGGGRIPNVHERSQPGALRASLRRGRRR